MFTLAASSYVLLLLALFFIGGMLFAFGVIWLATKTGHGDDPDYGAAA